jgi:acyl-CoA thioesterase I
MTNEADDSTVKVTFFGDSIFVGQGVSIYRGWVTRIAQFLDEYGEATGQEFLVTNASVNGRTTRQALEDMPYSVQSHGVDILVVQFGLNDCNYWATDRGLPRVSIGAFIENLKEIVYRARVLGARKIFVNNNHPTSRVKELIPGTHITYEDSNREYSYAISKMARGLGSDILFQDVYQYFSDLVVKHECGIERYLLSDGLHLSVAGHEAYYALMQPLILSAVQEIS